MCDCFHMVLPTWPGAPGSVSGRQLQPEPPEAETEEDHSVTEGPEVIRPRPQGSSPVYECVTEGAGSRLQEDAPRRPGSSGRRRSWWKRDSGDSRTLPRMSHLEEATEVTLETEVEAGASGYSVTGGGDQGIFVTQVLKDSSAAKLFSLREGDQLLSATIFFDGITYEDALKILQYSEPYKVQFKIRRKLPAREDKEGASGSAQHGLKGSEEQEQDVTDGGSETPTRTLVGDGDQERLISRPREGRRPQRHRLSWPKFQAIQSRRAPGPRRSRSSSEADERRAAPEVSPGSTDTEAQHLAEEREQKAGPGSQQGGRFRNFTFRVSSGKRRSPAGRPGRGTNEGTVQAGVLEEAELPPEPGQHSLPGEGTLGQEAASAPRQTKTDKELEETAGQAKEGVGLAPGEGREGLQGLEGGIARLALRDTADLGARRSQPTELRVQTPTLTTPKFGIAKEKAQETEEGTRALPTGPGRARGPEDTEARREDVRKVDAQETHRQVGQLPLEAGGGKEEDRLQQRQGDGRGEAKDEEGTEGKTKLLKFKLPAFGWSPGKDHKTGEKPQREGEKKKETERQESLKMDMKTGDEEDKAKTDKREDTQGRKTTREKQEAEEIKLELSLGDKEVAARDSKFKMPKFKMPSFGVSAPGKSVEAAVEVSLPKAEADASAPSGQAAVKAGDLSAELPSAELDVKGPELGGKLPEGQLPDVELKEPAAGIALKGHLPKVQMPSIKVPRVDLRAPQVDIKGPKLDLKGAKGEVSAPDVAVSPPSVELEAQAQAQAPGGKLEADVSLGDKEVAARDSKFKMPKFKMPSFGVSAPGKSVEAAVEVSLPKAEADASAPSGQAAVKAGDLSAELPSAELDVKGPELGGKLPEGQLPDAELKEPAAGTALKGHLPKVQMPSIKVPRVDLRAPQVDIKGPKLDLKGAKGEVSAPDVAVSPPSVELEAQAQAQAPGGKLEADVSLGDKEVAARDSKFKMPKFKMPSFGVSAPGKSVEAAVEVSLPKAEADASAPSGQAAVKAGDLSAELPSAELDVKGPELGGKLPEGQLPDAELKEPAAGIALKGHLPKVQMPSIKVPRVDLRAPQVDIKGPKLDLKGAKGEVSAPDVAVSPPSVELEAQAQAQAPGGKLEADVSLGDKEVAARDSKFKMPKFKMPSFGVSAPGKSVEAAVEVSLPKAEADASAPSGQAAVKAGDLSAELPSAELDVKGPELGGKLPEGQLPDAELKEPAAGTALKGHLPKVQMPSIKVPRVDLRAPQVDIKGPKLDLKGAKGEVSAPDVAVSPPSVELEAQAQAQAPGGKLEADVSLGDKEVAARDSKFKMPKFKMPSFGVSAPGKSVEAAVEVSLPKAEADASAPSGQAAVKAGDLSAELPSAELDVKGPELGGKLPEGQLPDAELKEPAAGIALKGHLPKVQMPSIKVPRVDLRAPQVDIKGPKLDLKGAKGEVSAPDVAVSPPSVELEAQAQAQAPGGKLEADVSLGDKEVAARDSKFKMPKFKMPSFGVSAPGKSVEAAVEVSLPKAEADASAPSGQAAVKAGDLSAELPSAELDVKGPELGGKLPEGQLPDAELKEPAAGIALKGHLPKVQMPSIKVPRVDLRAPQVDIKGPKLDLKGAKGEVSAPDVAVSPPSVELEAQAQAQAPGGKLEADVSLGDKEVAARDSKFKMPKFKMPSFGVSAPGKSVEAAVEVSLPKAEADASAPSGQAAVKAGDLSAELPSAELDVKGPELGGKLPEGQLPDAELKEPAAGIALKGHLPKVQMPSIKVPRVDLRAPQVDIKGPKLDLKGAKGEVSAPDVAVSPPSVELEAQAQAQAPGGKLEADVSLGDKEVAARDSKFKMPKFKMPSFGVSAPGKSVEAAVEVSLPKAEADASAPSGQAAVKAGDLSAELPSAELDVKGPELGGKLPEGQLPDAELKEPAAGTALKGHLPKVQMPSIKVPRVDLRAPQVDIKGPKLDLKGAKGEVSAPDVAVSPPSVELEAQAQAQAPGGKLEADVSLGDKEVAARDSKFKMPKFKMPSFGVSAPGKSVEAAVEVSLPKAEADASAPSGQAAVKAGDLSAELPSAELDVKGPELGGKLPEGQLPDAELKEPAAGTALKGHLPKVQMPSIKVPRVDLRAPQVDIKGPKLDLKGAKGEVSAPDVAVSPPSVELEAQAQAQAPGGKLEADVSLGDKEVAARDSKFKMPKFKMPSFGVSAPGKSVEAAVEVSLPKAEADASAPSGQAAVKAGDLSAELPSAELDVKGPELGGKLPEGQLPDAELKEPAAGTALKGHLPKVQMPSIKVPRVDLRAPQVDIKGPKLDLKGAKGEVSAPDVAVSPPSVELEAQAQAQAPGGKLEADVSLGDKEVAARDSKFKMPKFKMPSFGVSAPGKSVEAAVEVSLPKAEADASAPSGQAAVKAGDLSAELPSAELDVKGPELGGKLPEGQLPDAELKEPAAGIALKGHLPKVQMPSIKVPRVDLRAPQVDIKGPKLDLKGAKGEVSAPDVAVSPPSVELEAQAQAQAPGGKLEADVSLGDKEVAARDSKFKMPKFKMPSFGVSAPGKSVEAAVEVSLPKAEADASAPSGQAAVKAGDLSAELPSAELDVKGPELGGKLPEGQLPDAELKEPAAGIALKGHLPKVQMPSIKVPRVDLRAPQVDIKGPKLDLKGAKGEVSAPDVAVSPPSVELEAQAQAQAPGGKLEADVSLGDKEVAARDSKFKMPKFKMPSFGVSAPGKSVEAAVEVSLPKAEADASAPSGQAAVKAGDLSAELPSAELDVKGPELGGKLPEGQLPDAELKEPAAGTALKGHLPKVQMPSIKVPRVDLRAPQVDIKGPKLDLKGAKGEVSAPDVAVSPPSVELEAQAQAQAPGGKLEADVSLGDKEVAARDSKFKMPKFKMPSFGVSAPGKSVEAAVEVSLPKAEADASAPSGQAAVKAGDLSAELPSAELDVKGPELGGKLPEGQLPDAELKEPAAGTALKGHLPKVQMPSIKVPRVDLRAPQVDIKGPKLDLKGAKGEVSAPDVAVSPPSVELEAQAQAQAPGGKLEADVSLGDKEVAARDSKFKMPKFKMPSFGVSAPGKSVEAAVEVSLPKAEADASAPSGQAAVKAGDLSAELPSAELDVKGPELGGKLPEGQLPDAELKEPAAGIALKGHLPKVQMPSIKVPRVDLRAPQVDIKGPKLDLKGAKGEVSAPDVAVSPPSVELEAQAQAQAPGGKLEADVSLGDKEVAARDSKFKMPKFKMPSFGVSAPGKSVEAAVEVSLPKAEADASAPSGQAAVKAGDLSAELPSAELDVKGPELGGKLPEGQLPDAELKEPAAGIALKGHLPKVQMPSIKVPRVDLRAPQVDIKGPKLDLKGAKGEVSAPDVAVSPPSVELEAQAQAQAPGGKLEADVSLGDKEVAARDSKFKMPKFKMPSFGVSAPGKSVEAAVEVSLPKAEADASAPSGQAAVKAGDLSAELPSAELDVKGPELGGKLPEGQLPDAELKEPAAGIALKGHLPKVQMPSIKVPRVDLRAPQVDIKGPKLDLKGAKGEVSAPDVAVSPPSVELEAQAQAQAPGGKLEADVSLGDKEVAARDSKFKMPKFKMPSFGVSAPGKSVEAAVEVSLPKAEADASAPSGQAAVKAGDLSAELPSAELDVKGPELGGKLPEGQLPDAELKEPAAGIALKGHLPKVQMPSIKVPRVDLRAPQVDIKGPKLDLKGAKGEVSAPDVAVSPPSVELEAQAQAQAPGGKLEADVSLGDKEVAARDSKFKMPKFKMPSFGVSAPGKSVEAAVEVSLPKAEADASAPSGQAAVKAGDLSAELPSAELDVKGPELGGKLPEGQLPDAELKEPAAGIALKGHLPKVQMPSIKVPRVDLRAPQVDIKGPKLDLKGAKGEVSAPDVAVSPPSVELEAQAQAQAPGGKLEADVSLGDKEVAARDSKFKMPKFKMPSFGVSAPGKSVEAAVEVSLPKAEADASAPSGQAAVKAGDLSAELPSAELDVKGPELGGKLPEGQLPDAELKEPAAGIALKGHLPKVQMPSIKVPRVDLRAPQVDIKGPKLDLKGAKGEVSAPDVAVSPPSVELEAQAQAQAPGGKLEADVSLGDKEVAARDSKFVVPNFNVSLFASSSTKSSVSSSPFTLDGQHGESVSSSSPSDSLASSFDVHISKDPEADGPPLGPDSDLIPLKKSPFEIPQVFPSPESSSAESSAPDGSAVGPVLPRGGAPFSELSAEGSFKGAVPTRGSPLKVPWLGWPGFSSGRLDLSGTHAEAPSSPGVTLTKYRETLPSVAVLPELPLESSSGSQDARLPAAGGPASLPPLEGGAPSPAQSPAGPVDPLFPASYGRVTFPIFHRPKFAFSIPKAAKAELDPCTVARDLAQSAPSPGWGLDSAAEEAPGLLSPGSQPSRLSVSVPRSGGASEAASGEAPAEDAGREGRGGPLKTQRIQLPSFRRSPEKGAGRAAVPAVTVGAGPTGALPGVCVSPVEVLPEKEGEEGAAPSGCAGLQPTPPSLQASEGAAGLLRGDPAVSLSPAPRGEAGVGGPRTMAAPPEGAGVDPHLPQVQAPRLGSADLALRLGKAKAEVSLSAGSPPQEHRPSAGDGSQGHRPGDVAASRLQPSCGSAHAEAPVVESPEAATTAGSQGGWFRMPALRLPSVRRSAKEKGGAGASAASTARGGEVPAAVKGQGVQVPGSDVEAAVSLRPPETGADEAAAESTLYADVLRRNLDGQGLELHLPPAGVSPADLSTAQVSVRPGDGSLPLQMPGGRLSEARAPTGEMDATPPAGPAGLDLAGGAERAEERPSLPEGPVRLKASRTDRPSQVSVVDMGQPWEGSVLTVKLPRLSVPRFAFPDASSEADVFIPAVTEVSSLDDALGTESAGVWGASILKAGAGAAGGQPVALDLSPEASRISKVRVHIQGAQGEGPEVAVHRRVTAELVDLSGPAAISTQVVRESEIPASEVQRASYGFSLLKGRVPEPPTQVRGQDSWPPEGSPEAPKRAAPGADRLSGDPQPDTGEAFEVVLPGASVSGRPAITPDVHTEPQGADSGSDEEPAEILEFPPEEDSEEAAACLAEEGRAAQEKPEGKRSSGLFRFWLPNIGFSSSVEETRADPNVDRSAPVQTQPGPRPEAEPPKKQEKGGWFRFPKLGFSSTPTKKSKSSEDTVTPAEQKSQEEAVTFFDARESFSPEDKEEGEVAEAMGTGQGTGAMVTSAARTELILLEQDPDAGDEPAPGPASQGGQT